MRFLRFIVFTFWSGAALAQTTSSAGQGQLAQQGLAAAIARVSAESGPREFEIGMLRTLRAVEKVLQARYEYGLGDDLMPDLQLPVWRLGGDDLINPTPSPSTPDTLTSVVEGFVTDIALARASLEAAETNGVAPFELALTDIWFDINNNGRREEAEAIIPLLGEAVLGRWSYRDFIKSDAAKTPLIIRFDEADHAWLLAYTHLLSGFGNLFLAFDPAPVLRDLAEKTAALADAPEIPLIYDPEALKAEIAALEVDKAQMVSQRDDFQSQRRTAAGTIKALRKTLKTNIDETHKADLKARIEALQEAQSRLNREQRDVRTTLRSIENEIKAAQLKLPGAFGTDPLATQEMQQGINLVYIILTALAQEPDPARIRAIHGHLQGMIANNRVFWARLAEETDNDREWIPNESQDSALPLTIRPGVAESWQAILKDIEMTLEGKLLIPHWLLPDGYGISLSAYVADPAPVDVIGWVHGVDLYRYAARGPRLTLQSWWAFIRLTRNNAGSFALFLN